MFSQMEDEYFRARSADMKDIAERVIAVLAGREQKRAFDEPVIVAADDLMPSETVQMDKNKVLAFVTRQGSANSHTGYSGSDHEYPGTDRHTGDTGVGWTYGDCRRP